MSQGLTLPQVATVFDFVRRDRQQRSFPDGFVDLVTTGPAADVGANRDTAVVVRELFANATESVLIRPLWTAADERVVIAFRQLLHRHPWPAAQQIQFHKVDVVPQQLGSFGKVQLR